MAPLNKSKKGFSLLELLVSIGILSTGILVILQAVSFCSRITTVTNDTLTALMLAQDKLQELQRDENTKTLAQQAAPETIGNYRREYTLNSSPEPGLYNCQVILTWERPGRSDKLSVDTLLRK